MPIRRTLVAGLSLAVVMGGASGYAAHAADDPAAAWRPYVSAEHVDSVTTEAFFTSADSSGRYRTFIQVFASDSRISRMARPELSDPLAVDVRVRDEQSGEFVLDATGYAQVSGDVFETSPSLDSGRIRGEITGTESVASRQVTLSVDLHLAAVGPPRREHDRILVHEDGFTLNATGTTVSREGQATGAVAVDGRDYASGPSFAAPLVHLKSGGVTIVWPSSSPRRVAASLNRRAVRPAGCAPVRGRSRGSLGRAP